MENYRPAARRRHGVACSRAVLNSNYVSCSTPGGSTCAAQCGPVCVSRGERSGAGQRLHPLGTVVGSENPIPGHVARRATAAVCTERGEQQAPGVRRASLDVLGSRMLRSSALVARRHQVLKSAGGSPQRSSAISRPAGQRTHCPTGRCAYRQPTLSHFLIVNESSLVLSLSRNVRRH